MARANHIIVSFVASVLGVVLLTIATISAHADTAGIRFTGVVSGKDVNGAAAAFPRTLVSFSNQAALPIGGTGISPERAVVLNDHGSLVTGSAVINLASGAEIGSAILVPLSRSMNQSFTVCERDTDRCLRYRVKRY